MSKSFLHFLSYGSTDQETVRSLPGFFDGLSVPGTIAAFQAEGTKGFVLTLSARSKEPYFIDPRFPLFQNTPQVWKKSHLLLAEVLGISQLLDLGRPLVPADFTADVVRAVATGWLAFNHGFEDVRVKTFDKYAARLPDEDIRVEAKESPKWILAPYVMVAAVDDPWRDVSERLWLAVKDVSADDSAGSNARLVIAADAPEVWGALARDAHESTVFAWVSNLDEFDSSATGKSRLLAYAKELESARRRGQQVFALYGGFFSVLLARFGLRGASHGVGYGEHRNWVELPSSGAPPARYYVRRLHKYVSVDVADAIWRDYPELVECDCPECVGRAPTALSYHELMRHSVRMRDAEIRTWAEMATSEVVSRLEDDFLDFQQAVANLMAPVGVRKRAESTYVHLAAWAHVLAQADS